MQSSEGNDNEPVFVIEVCSNCKDHRWNTRHDQAKYDEYFMKGKSAAQRFLRTLGERDGPEGALPSILSVSYLWLVFSVVISEERYRGAYPRRSYHEKPDSKVVPAPRLVL